MTAFRPHQKQFILGPKSVSVWPDWEAIKIAEGLVLSTCPKLAVSRLQSRDGVTFYLLGFAVLADQPMTSISDGFHLKHSSEIEEWTGFWAGKWALTSEGCIWPDATGCLGIHYRKVDREVWISSSPALLSDYLPNAPPQPYIAWQVRHGTGIDWIPPPFTTRENIYKVLPLRTINPLTGAMNTVRFRAASGEASADGQSLASAMTTIIINWARGDFRDRYLSLTAGVDTRTILAAASSAGLKVEARTVAYPEASRNDLAMPPRIAAAVGIPHKLMRRPNPPLAPSEIMARARAIVEHMDGATFHPISADVAHGMDDFMNDPGRTMTIGHILPLGRCAYWRRFGNAGLGDALPSADQLLDAFFTRSYDRHPFWSCHPRARWRKAMQVWLESLAEPRALQLDWREAFHLDQQQAGWGASIHRLLDINDGSYFVPANCLWVLHLLVRDPVQRKLEAFAQRNTIRLLAPVLAKIPTNPPSRFTQLKQTVKSLLGEKRTGKLKSYAEHLNAR